MLAMAPLKALNIHRLNANARSYIKTKLLQFPKGTSTQNIDMINLKGRSAGHELFSESDPGVHFEKNFQIYMSLNGMNRENRLLAER